MKIFNINFGLPLKTFIEELNNVKGSYGLEDFFVAVKEPSPQAFQKNKTLVVNVDGFMNQEQLLRLYSISVFMKTVGVSFSEFEEYSLSFEKLLSNFKKDHIKFCEIESINHFTTENENTLEKLFVINALVQAEQN